MLPRYLGSQLGTPRSLSRTLRCLLLGHQKFTRYGRSDHNPLFLVWYCASCRRGVHLPIQYIIDCYQRIATQHYQHRKLPTQDAFFEAVLDKLPENALIH